MSRPAARQAPSGSERADSLAISLKIWSGEFGLFWFAPLVFVALFAAYHPALQGGRLWDDDAHITAPELQSASGLLRIWSTLGATQQYYPVVHTAFWVEHRFFGDATPGYHVVNILLHGTSVILLAIILNQLKIPGARLAALIWALHPVQVETVAWISELKNTLSTVFYLGAALTYLRFDRNRSVRFYLAALAMFVLALLSKSVTATLPAALLVIFWWKRGKLSWEEDVLPLLPWLVVGLCSALLTAWVERTIIGAQGEAFALTPIQRVLLAGRVVWFYFGKLLWPANLIFVYPRWEIRPDLWWSYLFPLSAVAATIAGVLYSRKYGRGPLAATLFFVGTLFPVLGFVNVFPFLFSYVADHFQYVAGIGIVVGMTAAATLLLRRAPLLLRRGLSGVLLATLGVLTWRQCRTYGDVRTLYVTTLRANPRAWMAHHNLAVIDHRAGLFGDAMDHFDAAMKIYPQSADLNYDYANLLVALGRRTEAIDYYQRTVKLRPSYASAYHNLGLALAADGNHQQAIEEFRTAIRFDPRNPRVHNSLATSLFVLGQRQSAMEEYLRALELDPTFPEAHYNLGLRLDEAGQIEQAMNQYRLALKFRPGYVKARDHLNSDLARQGQP